MIERVQVECVVADEVLAVVRVQVALATPPPDGATLAGVVRGPYSDGGRTLPAEFALLAAGERELTAKVVDPCYSSDELRMEYELELEVRVDGVPVSEYRTRVEFRRQNRPADR